MACMTLHEFYTAFWVGGKQPANVHLIMTCPRSSFRGFNEIKCALKDVKERIESMREGEKKLRMHDVEILSVSSYLNFYDDMPVYVLIADDLTLEE